MRPDLPSDAPRRRLALREGSLSYTDEGDGPAVVCLHGLPGSARDFRWLAPALVERGFRVLRFELPGFGESTSCPPLIDAFAERIDEGIGRLELEQPILLGHSFGGVVALRTLARFPRFGARLVLVASPGFRRHRAFRSFGWGLELARHARRPIVGRLVLRLLQDAFRSRGFRNDTDEAKVVLTLELIRKFDFGLQADSWTRLDAPTAVVWSDDDPFIEAEIGAELARRMPAGPRICLEGGGHNPQKNHAVEIAEALAAWGAAKRCAPAG